MPDVRQPHVPWRRAFGTPTARTLQTQGDRVNLFTLQTTLAGPFCALPSGSPLIDATIGLPAPAVATMQGRVDLLTLLRLFGLH